MPFLAPVVGAFTAAAAQIQAVGFFAWLAEGSLLAGIVKQGFSMAAQVVLGDLFGPPKARATASQLQTSYGDNLARSAVLGRVGTAGHHIFRNANGKGNRTVRDVHVVSHFRVSEIRLFRGQGSWRMPPGPLGGKLPGIDGGVWIESHLGTMDQAASTDVINNSSGRWTADARGAGVAYFVARTRLDREKLTQPWEPFAEVWGPYLYDWRKDSSVGGDGADRWSNQDSWSGRRENPVLQMYALERGLYNGTELMVGRGSPASSLPLAEWTIAANICDEDVAGRPRYSASIIALAGEGDTHEANMRPLREACAASWIEGPAGQYPIVGAAQAVVATFTDDDVDWLEPFRFAAKRPRDQLVNTAAGSFTNPIIFYERGAIATRIETGALAEDGERLAVPLPFPAVTDSRQADELADIALRANRYQANAEICLRPKFLRIQPGRWVRWNSVKYGDRTYLVTHKRLGKFGTKSVRKVYLTLQEVGSGIFTATGYETVPTSPAPPGTPDYQSELDNFLVQPWVLTSEATGSRPAIRLSYDAIEDVTITGVDFEYWPTAQPAEIQHDSAPADFSVKFLTVGIISETEYQVRYRLRADPQRNLPWVGPVAITTPSANSDDVTVKLANLSPGAKQLIQGALAQLALSQANLQQLAAAAVEGTVQASEARQIAVRFQDATAAAVSALNASIGMIDGQLTAQAEAFTAVNATLGTTSSGALFRLFASAGEDDVIARIELQVRASTGSSEWATAGTIWEVGIDDEDNLFGRIVLAAARTMISTEMGDVIALFDEDGVHLSNAFIANLTGDHIAFNTLTGDHIVALSIDSPSLAFGAVTEFVDIPYLLQASRGSSGAIEDFGWTTRATVVVVNPYGTPSIEFIGLRLVGGHSGSGGTDLFIRVFRDGFAAGNLVAEARKTSNGGTPVIVTATNYVNDGLTSHTYYVQTWNSVTGSNGYNITVESTSGVLFWKR